MKPYVRMLKMLLWRKSSPLFIFYLTYYNKGFTGSLQAEQQLRTPEKPFCKGEERMGGGREDRREGKLNRLKKNLIN